MSARPPATPGLLAALAAAVPARLVKKLDQSPGLAEAWRWEESADGVTVGVDAGVTVRVRAEAGVVAAPGQLSCTCLLAPRCLHVLAVAAALPIAEAEATPPEAASIAAPSTGSAAPPAGRPPEIAPSQRAAAVEALRALGELVGAGALGAGTVLVGELLRAVHAARIAELPRLSSALLRVATGVRACRERSDRFALEEYAADLGDALTTAQALAREQTPEAHRWVGTARRSYAEAGTLRLHGLATQPVVTGSGYAGVLTFLIDPHGALFTLAEVMPGDVQRLPAAYAGAARLGNGSLTHRELGRAGLFIEGATVSAEGRLGAGQGVRAVLAPAVDWGEPPLDALFRRPLVAQVRAAFEELAAGAEAAGLLLFDGVVQGASEEALLLAVPAAPAAALEAVASQAAPAAHDNLRLLARHPGVRLRLVARLAPRRPRRVELLALGPAPGSADLVLPPEWSGRCNVGLDRLPGAAFTGSAAPAPVAHPAAAEDGPEALLPLRRRLERLALGGRGTFAGTVDTLEQDARALERDLMPAAGALLRALGTAALDRGPERAERLARAAAGASHYLRTARRVLELGGWEAALGQPIAAGTPG